MANVRFHRVQNLPSSGTTGHLYFVTSLGVIYIYTGSSFEQYGESYSNKVTSIDENSTDTQYPSAKCVYDYITENEEVISTALNSLNTGKISNPDTTIERGCAPISNGSGNIMWEIVEDPSNKVTSLSSSSTDIQYPSAKAVYDSINDTESGLIESITDLNERKEDKSNKVTSLSSESTDTQYPSAKCVYDRLDSMMTTLLATNITSNGVTLTLQQWIDRISAVTTEI